jgi:hypothetical protein
MSYREEMRADRAAERTANREDMRLTLEAQLKAKEIAAEQARQDKEAEREQARRDADAKRRQEQADKRARQQEKERKRAAARARRARITGWLKGQPETLFVAFVMVASVVPAVISQVEALDGAGVFAPLAVLLASMLEGGAWAITFMGQKAEKAGRSPRKYRIGTWVVAAVAAVIQFWHWSAIAPLWVALVFAASSLFAIYVWDLKTHQGHARTREEKRAAKARREHLANRRKHHKDVAAEADRLLSALPFESISEEEAFAVAWRMKKGAEPGLSAEVYAEATNARVALGAAFELGEHVRPELVRAGMLASLYNPLPHRLSEGIPTLGPTLPIPALQRPSEGPTALAGIGLYGFEGASENARENANQNAGDSASGNSRGGRSDEEIQALVPDGLKAAAELVAEGKPISAAGLSKQLGIRRDDARRLRDLVVAERKLRLIDTDTDAVVGA